MLNGGRRLQQEHLFHRAPEAFDDRYRPGVSDSSESMLDSRARENVAKQQRCELRAVIGNEVLGYAVLLAGGLDDPGHLVGSWFFEEHSERSPIAGATSASK